MVSGTSLEVLGASLLIMRHLFRNMPVHYITFLGWRITEKVAHYKKLVPETSKLVPETTNKNHCYFRSHVNLAGAICFLSLVCGYFPVLHIKGAFQVYPNIFTYFKAENLLLSVYFENSEKSMNFCKAVAFLLCSTF